MILKKHLSFIDKQENSPTLSKRIFKLDYALDRVSQYFEATADLTTNFSPLPAPSRPIYICGSGASSMQAQFLVALLQKYLGLNARFYAPFSLKKEIAPQKGETVIYFSQKLSQSTRDLINYYRKQGINVIVFTARVADNLESDVKAYKFLPPHAFRVGEQMIVPVIGPISSYLQIIRFVHFLMSYYGEHEHTYDLDIDKILDRIRSSKERFKQILSLINPELLDRDVVILGSDIYMPTANHIALTLTEGALMQAHAYEIENYTHGLRFFDRDKPRLFIILNNPDNNDFYQAVYPQGIFTDDHISLEFFSDLPDPFKIFEYEMFGYYLLQLLLKKRDINLRKYPGKHDPRTIGIHKIPY